MEIVSVVVSLTKRIRAIFVLLYVCEYIIIVYGYFLIRMVKLTRYNFQEEFQGLFIKT